MRSLCGALAWIFAFGAAASLTPASAGGDYSGGSQPTWIAVYSGTDISKDSNYFYSGAVVSMNRDLSRSGIVLRGFFGYGAYEYDNLAVAGGVVDGDAVEVDAMLGYMFVGNSGSMTFYVGVDYQNHDLTPTDPSNLVEGSETGFKVAADLTRDGARHYLSLLGSYSTAFDTYWTRGRVGLKLDRLTIGPEAIAVGNDGFDSQRVGGFAMTTLHLNPQSPVELTVSGGYQFADDDEVGSRGSSGGYGALNLSFAY